MQELKQFVIAELAKFHDPLGGQKGEKRQAGQEPQGQPLPTQVKVSEEEMDI